MFEKQRKIANKLLKSLVTEYGWTNVGVFLKNWDYLYSLNHYMFPKVKRNLSNLFLNVTAVSPKELTSGLHIT